MSRNLGIKNCAKGNQIYFDEFLQLLLTCESRSNSKFIYKLFNFIVKIFYKKRSAKGVLFCWISCHQKVQIGINLSIELIRKSQ